MRVFNFAAGPATLPLEVLQQAREELLDWHDSDLVGKARPTTPSVWDYKAMAAEGSMLNTHRAIDESGFYSNPVSKNARSWMNVPFVLAKPELDKTFLSEAHAAGLTNLEEHRCVGGMRASIYNAMPLEGVQALVSFMKEFHRRYG